MKWITEKLAGKNPKTKWQVVNTVGGTTRSSTKSYYTINGVHFNQKQTADMLNQFFSTVGGAIRTKPTHRQPPTHLLSVTPGQVNKWLKQINTKKLPALQTIQNVWQFSVYRYVVFLINAYVVANTPKFGKTQKSCQ